jgi:predicted nucleic acid-binding protein
VDHVRCWWRYDVCKQPKPDFSEAVMKLVPVMLKTVIAIQVVDEVCRSFNVKTNCTAVQCTGESKKRMNGDDL